MRRKKRNPEKFDPIELFTDIGRDLGYTLETEEDVGDFLERVGSSLRASITNPSMLHGKRAEAMFAHVVGALGRLIKQEDAGAVFVERDSIEVPDYRLILDDGAALLVEVKNFRPKDYREEFAIRNSYFTRLESYAELNGLPLKPTVYFSIQYTWVLLSREAFTPDGGILRINFVEAIARNEMALLGDRMIATRHDLCLEFRGDPAECAVPDENGEAPFIIRDIRISCGGKDVDDGPGKNIAFYLMRYGEWIERESEAVMVGGKVVGIRLVYAPMEPVEEQGPQIAGTLSKMVSNAYKELTVRSGAVIALDVKQDPDIFTLGIPDGYKGSLPLWQFILQPNYDLRARGFDRAERSEEPA